MTGTNLPLLRALLLALALAQGETMELEQAVWQPVPNTAMPQVELFSDPAYVDTRGLTRQGAVVTYDLVSPDAAYFRLETNCQTQQLRAVRQGFFETETRVNYVSLEHPWEAAAAGYQQAIVAFVCPRGGSIPLGPPAPPRPLPEGEQP